MFSELRRICGIAASLVLVFVLAGCITSPLGQPITIAELEDQSAYVVRDDLLLPAIRAVEGCGSQALACALHAIDPDQFPNVVALAHELPWQDSGATPIDILLEARRRGMRAEVFRGDRWRLRYVLEQTEGVVLVMFDAGPVVELLFSETPTVELMHWSVLSGMCRNDRSVLLAAESGLHYRMSREQFMPRWRRADYCMIVLRSG